MARRLDDDLRGLDRRAAGGSEHEDWLARLTALAVAAAIPFRHAVEEVSVTVTF